MTCCPTCGKELEPGTSLRVDLGTNRAVCNGELVWLSPLQAEALFILQKAAPRAVNESLSTGLWGSNGGPVDTNRTIRTVMSQIRKHCQRMTFAILPNQNRGYRLVDYTDWEQVWFVKGVTGRLLHVAPNETEAENYKRDSRPAVNSNLYTVEKRAA